MTSLQQLYERLASEIRTGRTELKITTMGQTLTSAQGFGVDALTVAPSGKMNNEAEVTLASTIEAQTDGRPVPYWDLNRLSGAFLVGFPGGEALLGGDVPFVSWRSSLASDLFRWPLQRGSSRLNKGQSEGESARQD